MSYTNTYSKQSRRKIGKSTSFHYLYVEFLPIYQHPRKDFRYYSDDRKGIEKGLERLKRKVLYGSCNGRFSKAILYQTAGDIFVAAYLPNHGEVDFETYVSLQKKKNTKQQVPPLLKAYIIYHSSYIDTLTNSGKKHPIIFNSRDFDSKKQVYGLDVGMQSLLQRLKQIPIRQYFKIALIYRQADNQKVALITPSFQIIFKCGDFKKVLQSSAYFKLW